MLVLGRVVVQEEPIDADDAVERDPFTEVLGLPPVDRGDAEIVRLARHGTSLHPDIVSALRRKGLHWTSSRAPGPRSFKTCSSSSWTTTSIRTKRSTGGRSRIPATRSSTRR